MEVGAGLEPSYRFRHSLIQEATYKCLLRTDRMRLHLRAAWALEASAAGRLEEVAGMLGNHFAVAGETRRAAQYLQRAGDRATSVFANDEAVASYRYGLELLGRDGVDGGGHGSDASVKEEDAFVKEETDIRLKLAYVLFLTGRYAEASETLHEGLRTVGTCNGLEAARLHNRLGWVELDRHAYDVAAVEFEAASTRLGNRTEDMSPEVFDLWFEIHLGQVHVHYWRDEPDELATVMAGVRPAFKAKGEPHRRRSDYLTALLLWQTTERRHRVDDEMLDNARKALALREEYSQDPGLGGYRAEVDIGWGISTSAFTCCGMATSRAPRKGLRRRYVPRSARVPQPCVPCVSHTST